MVLFWKLILREGVLQKDYLFYLNQWNDWIKWLGFKFDMIWWAVKEYTALCTGFEWANTCAHENCEIAFSCTLMIEGSA